MKQLFFLFFSFLFISFFCSYADRTSKKTEPGSEKIKTDSVYIYHGLGHDIYDMAVFGRDSLIFTSIDHDRFYYEEIHGKLSKLNDTIYVVHSKERLIFNNAEEHRFNEDSVSFRYNNFLSGKDLRLEYANHETDSIQLRPDHTTFKINRKWFNGKSDPLKIDFGYANPVTGKRLQMNVLPHSSVGFITLDDQPSFYIVFRPCEVISLTYAYANTQQFHLQKQKTITR
jgi:hypothetical protein